jgi:uncharacterized protein YprB with RNaseH-like and TPR domain
MSVSELEERQRRLARLRRLGLNRGAQNVRQPVMAAVSPTVSPAADAAHLPGGEVRTPFGPAWVREARYPLRQHPDLARWLGVAPGTLAALDRSDLLLDLAPRRAVFIDTETTGLGLGAGTYTFLIGIGAYEEPAVEDATADEPAVDEPAAGAFVVRQFFMRHPGEELAQLYLVEEALLGAGGIVSFNGRGFDMPLINNRFILNGMTPPLIGAPHLDLLPPARRLWKQRWGSCSLGNLERNVLGLERTTEDVPGYLIPDIYRQYYLTGQATEMLARVFYHNLQDIVSMPLLGARMARQFDSPGFDDGFTGLDPLECVSLARCYDGLGRVEISVRCYRAALERSSARDHQVLALRELSLLFKRLGWRDEAAELWEEWVTTVSGEELTPYVELAKHHEWRTGDLASARGWAAWALRIAEGLPSGFIREELVAELRHRLARIERKLSGATAERDLSGDEAEGL